MATTKKSKVSKENEMDRLSDLPDSLIHHILSFLDTKNAVQTCVLSKRWKHLWTCLPNLNFDGHSFRCLPSFKKFVRRVLSRREPSNLHSLKFHTISRDKAFIARVIRYAASHFVQEMYCKFNQELINQAYWVLPITSLRTLHVENCALFGDHFASCVYLEKLIIKSCSISGKVIKISAPRLVTVKMSTLIGEDSILVVSSPKLSSFCYSGVCPSMFSMDGCPLLDSLYFGVYFEGQAVLPFSILQELISHAKLPTIKFYQGFTVITISRNDDGMHAVIHNRATKKRRKLFWRETDEKLRTLNCFCHGYWKGVRIEG